jgi:hypothetical protein
MIEILEKLFGSAAKVKIMRLFLFNPSESFDLTEIVTRSKVSEVDARHNIALLESIGLLKRRRYIKETTIRRKAAANKTRKHVRKVRVTGWMVNTDFSYLNQLQGLLLYVSPFRNAEIVKRLGRAAKLKLVIMAGVFIQNLDSRIDLLIVADSIKKASLENIIKTIESELGREVKYAAFETTDFQYRMNMYDKLVRDVFDYPHEKALNKLGI